MRIFRTLIAFLLFAGAVLSATAQPAAANLELQYQPLNKPGPYTPGRVLAFQFTLTNHGPATAEEITLDVKPLNLKFQPAQAQPQCPAFPCAIPFLRTTPPVVIVMQAVIVADGDFGFSAQATFKKPGGQSNQVLFSGATSPPKTPGAAAPETPNPPAKTPLASAEPNPKEVRHPASDVNISAQLNPAVGPYRPGQKVDIAVRAINLGPQSVEGLQIDGVSDNLKIQPLNAGCTVKPCGLPAIGLKGSHTIKFEASITEPGSFTYTAHLLGSALNQNAGTLTTTVTGSADSPPPPIWPWILGILGLIGATALAIWIRRLWWRSRLRVDVSADPQSFTAACAPLSFPLPTVQLQVGFHPGNVVPGPIPVIREEVLRD
jgi:hypothetical protein